MKFGRLVVKEVFPGRHAKCLCLCSCGTLISVFRENLTSGNTKSCGCLHRESSGKRIAGQSRKHGHATRIVKTPEYISWTKMKERCLNPRQARWPRYGGRNIRICKRWLTFENFFADMGLRPKGTTLGRFRDSGNYEPGNVAWMTMVEQGLNRRKAA